MKKSSNKKDIIKKSKVGSESLYKKIITRIGTPVILSYMVVGILILMVVRNSVTDLTTKELNLESRLAASEVELYMNNYLEKGLQISNSIYVQELLTKVQGDMRLKDTEGFEQVRQTMENTFKSGDESLLAIFLADIDSSQMMLQDGYTSEEGWELATRPWYVKMKDANGAILSDPYPDFVTGTQCVTVAVPVYNESGAMVGAVGIDFSLDRFSSMLGNMKLRDTGFYMFTSENGQLIYHPNQELVDKNISEIDVSENLKVQLADAEEGDIRYTSEGTEVVGYVAPVGDTGWSVATGLPKAEFNEGLSAVFFTMIISFVVAIVVVIASLLIIAKGITNPIKNITGIADKIADGELNVELNVASNDEIGQLANSINRTVTRLKEYITYVEEITRNLENMADGDMRIELKEDYVGEFASIKSAFILISESLNKTLYNINESAKQVSIGSDQVSSGAQALASGSTEQAATVEELNATSMEVARQAEENSKYVKETTTQLGQSASRLQEGNEHMNLLANAMEEISNASKQIASITKVIEDIAFQTNILALNAAIEAARAGVAGKGFAVVAEEVGNLASRSAEAANQTASLIESSVQTVDRGAKLTIETAEILHDVKEKTDSIVEGIKQIETVSAQQVSAIDQVVEGLSQVTSVIQTNAATAEENSAASQEMSAQATMLQEEVGKFRLDTKEYVDSSAWEQPTNRVKNKAINLEEGPEYDQDMKYDDKY